MLLLKLRVEAVAGDGGCADMVKYVMVSYFASSTEITAFSLETP